MPAPTEPKGRRRVLAIWSAVSTPLILVLIGVAFIPGRLTELSVVGITAIGLLGLFAIEAIARGNLFRFLATLVTLALLVVVVTTIASLTVYFGWQTTVAICFFALAFVLMLSNLRELTRD